MRRLEGLSLAVVAVLLAGCGDDAATPTVTVVTTPAKAHPAPEDASKKARLQITRRLESFTQTAVQTTRQGSDLSAPANYRYHCDYRWVASGQEYAPQLIGPSTCSLWQIGARGQAQTSHLVPGTGTVTVARIKSGANPAPVSIATVRQYTGRDQQGNLVTTCCYGISQTAVINPTPNGVTEIPVNLRVEAKAFDPNVADSVGWHDVVAVNVHGETGTLPISDSGGAKPLIAPGSDPGAVWFFPKFNPSEHNQNIWFASGFEILMNYDWRAES